jgi:hypothetical protein
MADFATDTTGAEEVGILSAEDPVYVQSQPAAQIGTTYARKGNFLWSS